MSMMTSMKKIMKRLTTKKFRQQCRFILGQSAKNTQMTKIEKMKFLISNITKYSVVKGRSYDNTIIKLYKKVDYSILNTSAHFVYVIDSSKTMFDDGGINCSNGTIDYCLLLENSLTNLADKAKSQAQRSVYLSLMRVLDVIVAECVVKGVSQTIIDNLICIKAEKCKHFIDALQRILFLNQLLWQTGHTLVGLGRLDKILLTYYQNDINNGILDKNEAKELIKEFYRILHRDYKFKSGVLYGDTGQIIVLGGVEENGQYFANDLTYLFINAIKECQLPDPKILLRVSEKMPKDLLSLALETIMTGLGCPILSNDDVVIPSLVEFGYENHDAHNYTVAACWEPFPADVSAESCNSDSLNFARAFVDFFGDISDDLSYEDLIEQYNVCLRNYCKKLFSKYTEFTYNRDMLASCFNRWCFLSGKNIDEGGAKYNNVGFTGVGLANVVNSFLAIKHLVYDEQILSLADYKNLVNHNFDDEHFLRIAKGVQSKFGNDADEAILLTNSIINTVKTVANTFVTKLEGKMKFGLSSPAYIDGARNLMATPDGRKNNEPLNVHISCADAVAYTEIISFASHLSYHNGCINGNVVDLMVTPHFIKDNFDKFIDLIYTGIKMGFFQMQMNVIDRAKLIDAQQHPEKYPTLIVRVWGFSAYFNDLPKEYQDVIIRRAKENERIN